MEAVIRFRHPEAAMKIENLRQQLRGTVLLPGSEEYESSRRIWNAMIDRKPRAIACCSGPADVQAALQFAVEEGVYPAIRGGGHNAAGLAMVDDGLVIDLSRMKGIFVEPAARTATAQTGLTWGEFDRETHAHGLATTGGLISTTGIAGLTLGGGVGWLMGRCGLVCDNTLNYDLVLASGEMAKANASENPDLFWALKGGGGNFGVVTSITYRIYPIKEVLSGLLLFPLNNAREVLRFYRDFTSGAIPDELTIYAATLCTPDGVPVVALIPVWCGDMEEGERVLKPVRTFGSPIADMITRMPYPAMQQMIDGVAPFGLRSYWKSQFLRELTDETIDQFVEFAETSVSPRSIAILEHAHGAVGRVPADATAFPTRSAPYDLVVIGAWTSADNDEANIAWTRRFHSSMEQWSTHLVYVNAMDQDDVDRIPQAYGPNYKRLLEVKEKYDPENRFRRNQNIRPQVCTR
jgi:FAD/FMN-containing dehydrogenase